MLEISTITPGFTVSTIINSPQPKEARKLIAIISVDNSTRTPKSMLVDMPLKDAYRFDANNKLIPSAARVQLKALGLNKKGRAQLEITPPATNPNSSELDRWGKPSITFKEAHKGNYFLNTQEDQTRYVGNVWLLKYEKAPPTLAIEIPELRENSSENENTSATEQSGYKTLKDSAYKTRQYKSTSLERIATRMQTRWDSIASYFSKPDTAFDKLKVPQHVMETLGLGESSNAKEGTSGNASNHSPRNSLTSDHSNGLKPSNSPETLGNSSVSQKISTQHLPSKVIFIKAKGYLAAADGQKRPANNAGNIFQYTDNKNIQPGQIRRPSETSDTGQLVDESNYVKFPALEPDFETHETRPYFLASSQKNGVPTSSASYLGEARNPRFLNNSLAFKEDTRPTSSEESRTPPAAHSTRKTEARTQAFYNPTNNPNNPLKLFASSGLK
ncbi:MULTISPECIES: hypothetical protein [Pseudomonas]|uniref:Uncharacterized protein n=1 Tax=Pseudomonas quercus TaxID=2722792 RepID=A0ABX0YG05_9PSED|nr:MULTISPECIES: hypothetical protein [Pseudomonas]MBF7142425.1 hypothetical protein [Pseudomonas sp. LY10J]NJP00963.1 hypothetical protein [Pseudomonas quercus]